MSANPPTSLSAPEEARLDEKTERVMAGLYTEVGDADSWAAKSLRIESLTIIGYAMSAWGRSTDNE